MGPPNRRILEPPPSGRLSRLIYAAPCVDTENISDGYTASRISPLKSVLITPLEVAIVSDFKALGLYRTVGVCLETKTGIGPPRGTSRRCDSWRHKLRITFASKSRTNKTPTPNANKRKGQPKLPRTQNDRKTNTLDAKQREGQTKPPKTRTD